MSNNPTADPLSLARCSLREFVPNRAGWADLARLHNRAQPEEPTTPDLQEHLHRSTPADSWWTEHVLERIDGRLMGYATLGQAFWSGHPDVFHLHMMIDPAARNLGLGTLLYDRVWKSATEAHRFSRVTARTLESRPAALHFLEKRGFAVAMREPVTSLDLDTWDPDRGEAGLAKAAAHGIAVCNLQDLIPKRPDWQTRYWRMDAAIRQDIPSLHPDPGTPLEDFVRHPLGSPRFAPHLRWIAVEVASGEWIGVTGFWKPAPGRQHLDTHVTGVHPGWRRRGVATALKATAINAAADMGVRRIETFNEENNPMLQLNLALGFQPTTARLSMCRELAEAA